MKILMYEANGVRGLIDADIQQAVVMIMPRLAWPILAQPRVLDGTPLANSGTLMDERLPRTVEEFDALYPDNLFTPFQV